MNEVRRTQIRYITARDMMMQYEAMICYPKAQSFDDKPVISSKGNGIEDKYTLAAAYREETEKAEREMIKARKEAYQLISSLKDATERDIINRHYLMLETWEQIAEHTSYSLRQVYYIHGRALQNIALYCSVDL